jgi:hypothetical protein
MQSDCKEHHSKQKSSIRVNLDSDSSVIDPISFGWYFQPMKHNAPMISTKPGMQIDCKEQDLKHDSSICFNCGSDSSEINFNFEPMRHDPQYNMNG